MLCGLYRFMKMVCFYYVLTTFTTVGYGMFALFEEALKYS